MSNACAKINVTVQIFLSVFLQKDRDFAGPTISKAAAWTWAGAGVFVLTLSQFFTTGQQWNAWIRASTLHGTTYTSTWNGSTLNWHRNQYSIASKQNGALVWRRAGATFGPTAQQWTLEGAREGVGKNTFMLIKDFDATTFAGSTANFIASGRFRGGMHQSETGAFELLITLPSFTIPCCSRENLSNKLKIYIYYFLATSDDEQTNHVSATKVMGCQKSLSLTLDTVSIFGVSEHSHQGVVSCCIHTNPRNSFAFCADLQVNLDALKARDPALKELLEHLGWQSDFFFGGGRIGWSI